MARASSGSTVPPRGWSGDNVIIISYAEMEDAEARQHEPTVVFVDADNRPTRTGVEIAGAVA